MTSRALKIKLTSVQKRIMAYVEVNPGQTATEIAKACGAWAPTVSSFLNKQVKAKELVRKKGIGPRGGYGYAKAVPPVLIPRKSVWERLSGEDPV